MNDNEADKHGMLDDLLYSVFYIDSGSTSCPDRTKQHKDLADTMYTRWVAGGHDEDDSPSLYGITNYSSIYLTKTKPDSYLVENFVNLYGDMAVIALVQRASTLYIYNHFERIKRLGKKLSEFMSSVYLKEITEQIQGIEMFDMFRNAMYIDSNIEHIKERISVRESFRSDIFEGRMSIIAIILTLLGLFTEDDVSKLYFLFIGQEVPDMWILNRKILIFLVLLFIYWIVFRKRR